MSVSPQFLSQAILSQWVSRLHASLKVPIGEVREALAEVLGFSTWSKLMNTTLAEEIKPSGAFRPLFMVLPPLSTAKRWSRDLVAALAKLGHPRTLSQAQQAWAHAFGLSRWSGVAAVLAAAAVTRANPWIRVPGPVLADALLLQLAADQGQDSPGPVAPFHGFIRTWVIAIAALRDRQELDMNAGPSAWVAQLSNATTLAPVIPELTRAFARLQPQSHWVFGLSGTSWSSAARHALRDWLFTPITVADAHPIHPLRFLAVEPDPEGVQDAVVHYAYNEPTWERAGLDISPEVYLKNLLATSAFSSSKVTFLWHPYHAWSLPWGHTAKADGDNFPTLVLMEHPDDRVSGVLMSDSHTAHSEGQLAKVAFEPEEVSALLAQMQAEPEHTRRWGLYKVSNIEAASIEAALAASPSTVVGQKHVILYRGSEWLHGFWNDPAKMKEGEDRALNLSSIADFYGTPVSQAKKASRLGMANIRHHFTLHGDYALLDQAMAALADMGGQISGDIELGHPLKIICDWWNASVPEALRPAAMFRVYVWNEESRTFVAGDPDEPAIQAANMTTEMANWALFEAAGRPPVALCFSRSRSFNTRAEYNGTQVYYADGSPGYEIGQPISEVDEAYYSQVGLNFLASQ